MATATPAFHRDLALGRRGAQAEGKHYPCSSAVAVAQLVEPRVVVPVVGGSSPLRHPSVRKSSLPVGFRAQPGTSSMTSSTRRNARAGAARSRSAGGGCRARRRTDARAGAEPPRRRELRRGLRPRRRRSLSPARRARHEHSRRHVRRDGRPHARPILAVRRRIAAGDAFVRSGRWGSGWADEPLTGDEVTGSTLGIVGLGRIGHAVAQRARGFEMTVLYTRRTVVDDPAYRGLEELLAESDIVSLHLPLTDETRVCSMPRSWR